MRQKTIKKGTTLVHMNLDCNLPEKHMIFLRENICKSDFNSLPKAITHKIYCLHSFTLDQCPVPNHHFSTKKLRSVRLVNNYSVRSLDRVAGFFTIQLDHT